MGRVQKAMESHIGPLTGSENGEVAQDNDGDAETAMIGMAQMLGCQLGDGIGRARLGWRRLAPGQIGRVAVDGRRAGKDETLHRSVPAGIQQSLGGQDIVTDIGLEARAPTLPHPRLPGQMKNDIRTLQQRWQVGIGKIALYQAKTRLRARFLHVTRLAAPIVGIGEGIHPHHLVPLRQ